MYILILFSATLMFTVFLHHGLKALFPHIRVLNPNPQGDYGLLVGGIWGHESYGWMKLMSL